MLSSRVTRSAGLARAPAGGATNSISAESCGRSRRARAERIAVQAQPAGHDDQPAPLVFYLADVHGQQAGEGILNGVLGGADVAEHPKREVDQIRSMVPVRLDDLGTACRLVAHPRSFRSAPHPEYPRIAALGAGWVLPPTTQPWGSRSMVFKDPEGNLVNVFSRPGGPS